MIDERANEPANEPANDPANEPANDPLEFSWADNFSLDYCVRTRQVARCSQGKRNLQ